MTPYKAMYLCLFNAITDSVRYLEQGQVAAALAVLRTAQQTSEDIYLDCDAEDE